MRLGRPKKTESERKDDRLIFRVSGAEKREIVRAAQRTGIGTASAWVRMLALSEARRVNK
jgi:uncharacterized protein (DUF1778 family)